MEKENDVSNFLLALVGLTVIILIGYFVLQDKPRIEKKPEYIKNEVELIKPQPCLNSEGVPTECKGWYSQVIHFPTLLNMSKTTKKQYNTSRGGQGTKKYQCQNCKKPTNTIRVDVGLPMNERQWLCDKCYFKR